MSRKGEKGGREGRKIEEREEGKGERVRGGRKEQERRGGIRGEEEGEGEKKEKEGKWQEPFCVLTRFEVCHKTIFGLFAHTLFQSMLV